MEAGLPNVTGWWKGSIGGTSGGCVYVTPNYTQDGYGSFVYSEPRYNISLNTGNKLYGSSNTVTPLSRKVIYLIHY